MYLYGRGISKNIVKNDKANAAIMELSETYFEIHKTKMNIMTAANVAIGII